MTEISYNPYQEYGVMDELTNGFGDTIVPSVDPEINDYEVERIIFALDLDEVQILLFKAMGYKAKEIVQLLGLKKIKTYYITNFALKRSYERESSKNI